MCLMEKASTYTHIKLPGSCFDLLAHSSARFFLFFRILRTALTNGFHLLEY